MWRYLRYAILIIRRFSCHSCDAISGKLATEGVLVRVSIMPAMSAISTKNIEALASVLAYGDLYTVIAVASVLKKLIYRPCLKLFSVNLVFLVS